MKKKKESVIVYLPARKKGSASRIFELICFLAGIFCFSFFLDAVGISYEVRLVNVQITLFVSLLWLIHRVFRRASVFLDVGLLIAFTGYLIWAWDRLLPQFLYVWNRLTNQPVKGEQTVTEAVLVVLLLLSFFLFLLEFRVQNHHLFQVIVTILLLLCPMMNLTVKPLYLIVFSLFQFGSLTASPRQRYPAAAALILSFGVSAAVLAMSGDTLYRIARQADTFLYHAIQKASGSQDSPSASGKVSRGNHQQSNQEYLEVYTDRKPTQAVYLRGFTGEQYTGGEWTRANEQEIFDRAAELLKRGDSREEMEALMASMFHEANSLTNPQSQDGYQMDIRRLYSKGESIFYRPYFARALQESPYEDGYSYAVYEQQDMMVDWWISDGDYIRKARELKDTYGALMERPYTGADEGLTPNLYKLCQDNPVESRQQVLEFVKETLKHQIEYTRTPGIAPYDQDIVEYVMFESQKGYCVHYASAAVLMCRFYGVPARYVAGFALTPSSFEKQEDGRYRAIVTGREQHAWAEVYDEANGWTPLETTPALDELERSYDGSQLSESAAAKPTPEKKIQKSPEEAKTPNVAGKSQKADSKKDSPSKKIGGVLPAVVLSVTGLLLVWSSVIWRRRRLLKQLQQMGSRKLFSRMMEALAETGNLVGYTGYEEDFTKVFCEVVSDVTPQEAETMVELLQRAAFGPEAVTKEEDLLVSEIYRKTVQELYQKQNWRGKFKFKYKNVFL